MTPARVQSLDLQHVHGRVAFLPFVRVRLKSAKPEAFADQGDTLDAHLRRVRKERGLKQIEVAGIMGVSETSIVDWEAGKQPYVSMYPAIIAFLGYEPWPKPESLGGRLLAERRRRGMSVKQAAKYLGVDEGSFANWELAKRCPVRQSRAICHRFLSCPSDLADD